MRQLILFLAKYRSTLLLIVFVLIALLRHSLKNPVAEHRLNNVGFGTIASVHSFVCGGIRRKLFLNPTFVFGMKEYLK